MQVCARPAPACGHVVGQDHDNGSALHCLPACLPGRPPELPLTLLGVPPRQRSPPRARARPSRPPPPPHNPSAPVPCAPAPCTQILNDMLFDGESRLRVEMAHKNMFIKDDPTIRRANSRRTPALALAAPAGPAMMPAMPTPMPMAPAGGYSSGGEPEPEWKGASPGRAGCFAARICGEVSPPCEATGMHAPAAPCSRPVSLSSMHMQGQCPVLLGRA